MLIIRKRKIPQISKNGIDNILSLKKPKVETKYTKHPIIEHWNTLSNTKKHMSRTKTYKRIANLLNELESRGLKRFPIDSDWVKKCSIQQRFLVAPWPSEIIIRSIEIINSMLEPGYWPGPNSFLSRMNLDDVIYSARTQKSWIAYARNIVKARYMKEVSRENKKQNSKYFNLLKIFDESKILIYDERLESLCNLYNNINTSRSSALFRHLCPNIEAFCRALASWMKESKYKSCQDWMIEKFFLQNFNIEIGGK